MSEILEITMPIKTVSEANQSERWITRYHRKKQQQRDFNLLWRPEYTKAISLPCRITFTRHSCKVLDSDNNAGAFKHVRDSLAEIIGIDDGSDLIEWRYEQVKINKREHYFTVKIENLWQAE